MSSKGKKKQQRGTEINKAVTEDKIEIDKEFDKKVDFLRKNLIPPVLENQVNMSVNELRNIYYHHLRLALYTLVDIIELPEIDENADLLDMFFNTLLDIIGIKKEMETIDGNKELYEFYKGVVSKVFKE